MNIAAAVGLVVLVVVVLVLGVVAFAMWYARRDHR